MTHRFAYPPLFAVALLLVGCHAAQVDRPLTLTAGGNEPAAQLDFWHALADRPVVCNDEALHGLLLFLDGKDEGPAYAQKLGPMQQVRPGFMDGPATQPAPAPTAGAASAPATQPARLLRVSDYGGRVSLLQSRGVLPSDFRGAPQDAVRRGTLAMALLHVLRIKGGVVLQLLGPSERYAVRELEFMGLYPQSSAQQTFSGQEFLGIIGRAEDYQRLNPAQVPPTPLPGDIERLRMQEDARRAGLPATQPGR